MSDRRCKNATVATEPGGQVSSCAIGSVVAGGTHRIFGNAHVLNNRLSLRLVLVMGVSLGFAAGVASGQSAGSARLSGELQTHVKSERFQVVTSVRGLPLGVRDAMRALWGTAVLDIVDPDGSQPSDNGPNQSNRRLVAAGCSGDHCLISYELGGRTRSWRVVLFHWTPSGTRFEWGGTMPRRLGTLEEALNAALTGTIQAPTTSW